MAEERLVHWRLEDMAHTNVEDQKGHLFNKDDSS